MEVIVVSMLVFMGAAQGGLSGLLLDVFEVVGKAEGWMDCFVVAILEVVC
jgi:hypothetical protein